MFETACFAILLSFLLGVIFCPLLIPVLHRLKYGQTERTDGPQSHLKKSGTPTMGGIAILAAMTIAALIFCHDDPTAMAVLLVTLGFGVIGFLDDYIKVVKKRSLGLRAYQKIVLQLIVVALFGFFYQKNVGTAIEVPVLGRQVDLGIWYWPFFVIVILGTVNGVNLTDGLDGLAGGVTLLVAAFFMVVCWQILPGTSPLCAAVVGSLMAFLLFNSYPAKVFMGDTGSLALGGFVAAMALALQMPLIILLVGFIYLIESISVILQVASFKLTSKRIFKMAPIHHHFELCGWSETRVVTVFYVITAICCLIGLMGM